MERGKVRIGTLPSGPPVFTRQLASFHPKTLIGGLPTTWMEVLPMTWLDRLDASLLDVAPAVLRMSLKALGKGAELLS